MTTPVVTIGHLELAVVRRPWPFAEQRRDEIAAHFAAQRRRIPVMWNGRVLLMSEYALAGSTLRGVFFETDFASFIAWRDWGFPDPTVINCFAMGAIYSADGAFLLGVMGADTANAGRVYFPAGTPDLDDIIAGRLDLESNVIREVAEETGLTRDDFAAEPGWRAVFAGPRVALMKILHAHASAVDLRSRILNHVGREERPELTDIRIVRGPADFNPQMPEFVRTFLSHIWRSGQTD